MKLRKFDNITKVVREHGDDKAKEELEWLLKLARTNFAACYRVGAYVQDTYSMAIVELGYRIPSLKEEGECLSRICKWLYAQAKEKCTCQAPKFITGCENAIATKEDGVDECTCTTGECPWIRHTGVFL